MRHPHGVERRNLTSVRRLQSAGLFCPGHKAAAQTSTPNSWHDSRYAFAMPDDTPTIGLRVIESLSAVDAVQWDDCALAPGAAGNPFLSHGFLKALEDSK